jgi:hypothetical protein
MEQLPGKFTARLSKIFSSRVNSSFRFWEDVLSRS